MARPYTAWTDDMIGILTVEYPITRDAVLAEKLGVSLSTLRRKARELKLVKAGNGHLNYEAWETVESLYRTHTQKQIAAAAHVSERTVRRICKALYLRRDKEEASIMRSEGIKRVFRSENRRMVFGLDQQTNRFLGVDRGRQKIYSALRMYGYIVMKGSRTVYYSPDMRRIAHVESYAESLGFIFEQWNEE